MDTLPVGLGVAQPDLFADDQPAVDARFATAHRIALDETSWVEHVPGWTRPALG
ncbi:hypothetical protein [Catenulispora subtropica]|uniref:hypothetical protein n=1 Tax=Catenulispora subtropica TaxID=450798 RepID=UPI0031DBABD8